MDSFHIWYKWSLAWEGVSHVMSDDLWPWLISSRSFDLVLTWDPTWLNSVGNHEAAGVSSERRRSSCSSCFSSGFANGDAAGNGLTFQLPGKTLEAIPFKLHMIDIWAWAIYLAAIWWPWVKVMPPKRSRIDLVTWGNFGESFLDFFFCGKTYYWSYRNSWVNWHETKRKYNKWKQK